MMNIFLDKKYGNEEFVIISHLHKIKDAIRAYVNTYGTIENLSIRNILSSLNSNIDMDKLVLMLNLFKEYLKSDKSHALPEDSDFYDVCCYMMAPPDEDTLSGNIYNSAETIHETWHVYEDNINIDHLIDLYGDLNSILDKIDTIEDTGEPIILDSPILDL
jgi:hypothetical protein